VTDLVWMSMTELARRIAAREVSPVEVVQAHLRRIAALDGRLKSYLTVMDESALQAARAIEGTLARGQSVGSLAGVPVGLKDLYCTRGVKTTGGSRVLADWVPDEDATVVSRLTGAGAIVLGKLNMHEFAYGPEGLNPHGTRPRIASAAARPRDRERPWRRGYAPAPSARTRAGPSASRRRCAASVGSSRPTDA
jgi:aspartyl-tRNA(Asn)/glutamyl-tRNA(Gln) amidotransferase subunit A